MVTFCFIVLELYYLQNLREIMFINNTVAVSTKEKGKEFGYVMREDFFSEKIILLLVLMALTCPLIMILCVQLE